jgi:hypothetical protein
MMSMRTFAAGIDMARLKQALILHRWSRHRYCTVGAGIDMAPLEQASIWHRWSRHRYGTVEAGISMALSKQARAAACRQGRPETWCDITLWVGEERLPAHRALLACRSRTFQRLLTSKWLPHVRAPSRIH